MTHRFAPPIVSLLLLAPLATLPAQTHGPDTGTLVIAVPREAASPVPTLWRGDLGNREASDLMFLRLADIGPQLQAADENKFIPRLAKKWTRTDSLTLVFELDPRAKWQDGSPVVAADVVYAIERARNPKYGGSAVRMLSRIDRITADNPARLTVHFNHAYAEQLYDVVYHVPPLPSHLLAGVNPDSLGTSAFVANPIGNGPYRFVRRVPGQVLELAANPDFFLGRPKVERIVMRVASSPDARANMLRSGEVDALDNVYTLPDPSQVTALPDYRYHPTPGAMLMYLTFNQRNPADTSKPHPILADATVRRALVQILDREKLAQATLGPFTHAPSAPVSALVARTAEPPAPIPYDLTGAKQLLASRGWRDSNGDGVLDKDGVPLALKMIVPITSAPRRLIAAQIQEAYRQVGITLTLQVIEIPVYLPRRESGDFDLEFYQVGQDPTPSSLVTSWNCASSPTSNTGHYCNRVVDSLVALNSDSRKPVPAVWRDAVKLIANDYPAVFIAAPVQFTAIHKRFEKVSLRPESIWSDVWKWSVKPGAQLERDRQ